METNTVENTPVVATPEKAARVPKAKVTVEGHVLTFTFTHGAVVKADWDKLTETMKVQSGLHGLEQKLRDCYAGAKSSTEAEGLIGKVMDHLYDPTEPKWNAGKTGEPSEDSLDLLAQAVVNAKAKLEPPVIADLAMVRATIESMDKAGRAALRAKGKVMVEIALLKAAKQSNTDDLGI